ncbi:MAG: threonine/serine exporter family protein [Thermomicrobiales bacterium]
MSDPKRLDTARLDDPCRAVDLALRAAQVMLESGASGQGANLAVGQIAACIAPEPAEFAFAGDLVAVHSTANGVPFSLVRPVVFDTANFDRASAMEMLCERIAAGSVTARDIPGELDRVAAIPDPYGLPTTIAAAGVAGFAYAMLLGGDLRTALLALAACVVGRLAQAGLRTWTLPQPLINFAAALTASLVAAAGVRAGFAPAGDAISIPAVAWLIPGLALINGLLDLLSIRHTALGAQRTIVALIIFLLLGAAIAFGVSVSGAG